MNKKDLIENKEVTEHEEIELDISNYDEYSREELETVVTIAVDEILDLKDKVADYKEILEEDMDSIEKVLFYNRDIMLNDNIDTESSEGIISIIKYYNYIDDLNEIPKEERVPIKLTINSFGGQAYSAFQLVNMIENSATPIYTYVTSHTKSAGFLIWTSGHKRFMTEESVLMYHQASSGTEGTIVEQEIQLSESNRINNTMNKIIARKTNIPLETLNKVKKYNYDWYIDYEKALEYDLLSDID